MLLEGFEREIEVETDFVQFCLFLSTSAESSELSWVRTVFLCYISLLDTPVTIPVQQTRVCVCVCV